MESPFRSEDREAIRTLVAAYAHWYDEGQLDDFANLFAENGVLQLGPGGALAEGPADIKAALSSAETPGLRHFTTDIIIDFTGDDRAEGLCRFAVHSPARSFDGTYRDVYTKGADGWKFARRMISTFED